MKNPTHPGRFVRSVVIEPMGLAVAEAAKALGITRVALSRFLNERFARSLEMTIRLDKAFGAMWKFRSACRAATTSLNSGNGREISEAPDSKPPMAIRDGAPLTEDYRLTVIG